MGTFKIAVEGCGHGHLDYIYNTLQEKCESRGWTLADLDFLIICGDFQAIRNEKDLNCMSVPRRYRKLGDFHLYYSGKKRAPVLTLVIGGNHEASNHFSELHYGGWLAPNIYYLGTAGVLRYGPLRICGMSGIFNRADYRKPHHERLPYNSNQVRSVYHVRECDVSKLLDIRYPVDIGISHDWPRRTDYFGDCAKLFADRPGFFKSAKIDNLGSEPAEQVLNHLRPSHWFSGHMHIKYTANVEHKDDAATDFFQGMAVPKNIQEQLPKSVRTRQNHMNRPPGITNTATQFLALDRPVPGCDFLEVLEIESCSDVDDPTVAPYLQKTSDGKFALHYDEEWLGILRSFDTVNPDDDIPGTKPTLIENLVEDTVPDDLAWVRANITDKGLLAIPQNFQIHGPIYDGSASIKTEEQPPEYPNSQTKTFCQVLGIKNLFAVDESSAKEDDLVVFE